MRKSGLEQCEGRVTLDERAAESAFILAPPSTAPFFDHSNHLDTDQSEIPLKPSVSKYEE